MEHSLNRPLFLLGFMGAGKTTVGRLLGLRLDVPFIDLDCFIEEQASQSIDTLFLKGEPYFRELESKALAQVAKSPAVISVGGGTILSRENRQLIFLQGQSVYLHAPLTTLEQRLLSGTERKKRPLLQGNDATPLSLFYQRRFPFYEMATKIVQTDGKTPTEVADLIESML